MMKAGPGAAELAAEAERKSRLSAELEAALAIDGQGLSRAVVTLQTTRGRIRFRFYAGDAPKTTRRIAQLIRSGFYNGLIFHRVEPGFLIQGGDPTGTGDGGSGVTIPAEFNERKHLPGTVAMARSIEPDSADSQFYISLGTHPRLDGTDTVFGQVVDGLEVVNQIRAGDRMTAVSLEL
ncbi:MAG: peptidylprolyl isomerase [Proteobacteria bacterium]|nr:peptidylprolyl isomerase [Pseudomonadota bacterium]